MSLFLSMLFQLFFLFPVNNFYKTQTCWYSFDLSSWSYKIWLFLHFLNNKKRSNICTCCLRKLQSDILFKKYIFWCFCLSLHHLPASIISTVSEPTRLPSWKQRDLRHFLLTRGDEKVEHLCFPNRKSV